VCVCVCVCVCVVIGVQECIAIPHRLHAEHGTNSQSHVAPESRGTGTRRDPSTGNVSKTGLEESPATSLSGHH